MQDLDSIVRIAEIILFLVLSILAVYLIISLKKISVSIKHIEGRVDDLQKKVEPVLENALSISDNVKEITTVVRSQISKVDSIVDSVKERADSLIYFERKAQHEIETHVGVGHRVVHGGPRFAGPTIITPQVLEELRALIPLAPLHQPYNLAAIEAVFERVPGAPQVACFDTSFHRGQPAVAEVIPLPRELCRSGVQRTVSTACRTSTSRRFCPSGRRKSLLAGSSSHTWEAGPAFAPSRTARASTAASVSRRSTGFAWVRGPAPSILA